MNEPNCNISYSNKRPSKPLVDFIDSYWKHINHSDYESRLTIFPDSFFKLIVQSKQGKLSSIFLTGLWKNEKDVLIPANTTIYGIKFKLLAPEYLFQDELATILQSKRDLKPDFLNIQDLDLSSFKGYVRQIESLMIERLKHNRAINDKKHRLSKLLYEVEGNISAEDVSRQINWSNRQINRYLNKYLGVSLKTYLNIQKCYQAYFQIRQGQFHPEQEYYDQAHFIRQIKKHTGQTPKVLYEKQNDRFVQLSHFPKK
jgi:AraC-like DNA-binding protein